MISIQGLRKSYGDAPVLKGVDITIEDGEIYGLVGVSGAGKSTLLRCINGLESFDEGKLEVNGTDVGKLSERDLRLFRKNVGMIFQHFSLLERKTVEENVAFPMKCFGVPKDKRAARTAELLELVGLADKGKVRPRELSGGQKQRVAIARALTMNPSILLCDEATSALDPNITRSILKLLRDINHELGITIVVVTHAMSVVKEVCDKAAILDHGSVVYAGDVKELFLMHSDKLEPVIGKTHGFTAAPGETAYLIAQCVDDETLLSRLAIGSGVQFRVVWGGLDSYRGQMAGSYVVAVPDEQRDALEGFFAKEPSATWERLDGGER